MILNLDVSSSFLYIGTIMLLLHFPGISMPRRCVHSDTLSVAKQTHVVHIDAADVIFRSEYCFIINGFTRGSSQPSQILFLIMYVQLRLSVKV